MVEAFEVELLRSPRATASALPGTDSSAAGGSDSRHSGRPSAGATAARRRTATAPAPARATWSPGGRCRRPPPCRTAAGSRSRAPPRMSVATGSTIGNWCCWRALLPGIGLLSRALRRVPEAGTILPCPQGVKARRRKLLGQLKRPFRRPVGRFANMPLAGHEVGAAMPAPGKRPGLAGRASRLPCGSAAPTSALR